MDWGPPQICGDQNVRHSGHLVACADPAQHLGLSCRFLFLRSWLNQRSQWGTVVSERLGCSALLGHGPVGSCFVFATQRRVLKKNYRNQGNEKGAKLENVDTWKGQAGTICHLLSPKGMRLPGGSADTESACNAGDPGSIPWSRRSSGGGHDYLLQYSCLENSMDRGACWATVDGVTKSWTWLSKYHFHHFFT